MKAQVKHGIVDPMLPHAQSRATEFTFLENYSGDVRGSERNMEGWRGHFGQTPEVNRIMVPSELWHAQGLFYKEMGLPLVPKSRGKNDRTKFQRTWKEMADLAGNAFNAFAFNTALILGFIAWKP